MMLTVTNTGDNVNAISASGFFTTVDSTATQANNQGNECFADTPCTNTGLNVNGISASGASSVTSDATQTNDQANSCPVTTSCDNVGVNVNSITARQMLLQ